MLISNNFTTSYTTLNLRQQGEDDFENAHFDIKQLQHVLYKTPEELEKKLADKIEFWIR